MNSRRRARELALRILYAYELSQTPLSQIIKQHLKRQGKPDLIFDFCVELIYKTSEHIDEFNKIIKQKALNWDFERIAVIDRIIMHIAMCEFLYFTDIPPKVSIDEAIEIAKKYSTEKSGKFINGILDSVLIDWRESNVLTKKGRGLIEQGNPAQAG
jgi:transcription antitermination protein NusB